MCISRVYMNKVNRGEKVIFSQEGTVMSHEYVTKGTLEEWTKQEGSYCSGTPLTLGESFTCLMFSY